MHYLTLVTVDIPEIEEDFKENDRVRQAILKMKLIKKHRFEKLGKEPPLMMDINISNTQAMCSSFARAVDAAVGTQWNPIPKTQRILSISNSMTEQTKQKKNILLKIL